MSDVTIPCPHCGYRLPGTPGTYDTCQKCKKKIYWTKGRPYKTLLDAPDEPHVIKPPPSCIQPPPVPATEPEPEQSSWGGDASSFFNMVRRHEEQQEIDEAVEAKNNRLAKKERWLRFKSSTFFFFRRCWLLFQICAFLIILTIILLLPLFLLREHIPLQELSNLFHKYWKNIIAVAVLFIVLIFCVNVFVRFWKRFLYATKRTVIGDDDDWKNDDDDWNNESRYRHKKFMGKT